MTRSTKVKDSLNRVRYMSKLIWPDKDDRNSNKEESISHGAIPFNPSAELSEEEKEVGFNRLVSEIHRRERKKLYTKRIVFAVVVITIWLLVYFFA